MAVGKHGCGNTLGPLSPTRAGTIALLVRHDARQRRDNSRLEIGYNTG